MGAKRARLLELWGCGFFHGNTPCAIKTPCPIRHRKALHPYFGARFGGMYKFSFTHVNTYVAKRAAHGVEKDQVTRFEVRAIDFLGGGSLLVGPAW